MKKNYRMVKSVLTILLLILGLICDAQKEGNTKIIVKPSDTVRLYRKVKTSFINNDFIVKDLESDTLKTYPREFLNNNFLIATAIISGDSVILYGIYGSRKLNIFGYSTSPKDYKQILYYKGSVEWKLLRLVADGIGGEISFIE